MNGLEGRVAVITGGATLIGQKVAEAFIDHGSKVAIADINTTDGMEIAKRGGGAATFIETDVTNDDDIHRCLETTHRKWGQIDFLINLACTYLDNGMESSRSDWIAALNVNLIGAAVFSSKAVPYMSGRQGCAIVNFGSIGGKVAQPDRMLYSVSKAAMLGMTRNQALLLADQGIRVNSVSPGWTWSNVIRAMSNDSRERADEVAAPLHLNGRLVNPEEVANAVVYLCSAAASGINGSDVAVDGGYSAIGPEQKVERLSDLSG